MTHAGHKAYKKVDQRSRPCDLLVQLHEIKIILGAVGAFIVELEHAHVLLLDLLIFPYKIETITATSLFPITWRVFFQMF